MASITAFGTFLFCSMRKFLLLACSLGSAVPAIAQPPQALPARPAVRQTNNLVHTRLDVKFDYAKRYLYGREWVTLKPHGQATDTLRLDAKGMDIKAVELVQGNTTKPLKYAYNQRQLLIRLGRPVPVGEAYTVYLEYTAKPDELGTQGGAAIRGAKGLYFINPDSAVKGKPVQIWTQGEPDANSVWFPTIDEANQKTTQEINLTVPSKYVTLSNGQLVKQVASGPGLRTDSWKMDEPHAPYCS